MNSNNNQPIIYEGETDQYGLKSGMGTVFVFGEKVFEGQFENDLRNGHGRCFQKGELIFEGQFENGLKHGYGTIYKKDGSAQFEGQFNKDRLTNDGHSKGINNMNTGNYTYQEGEKHGRFYSQIGLMYEDGICYEDKLIVAQFPRRLNYNGIVILNEDQTRRKIQNIH